MKSYILSTLFIFFLIVFLPFAALLSDNRDNSEETLLSYTVGAEQSDSATDNTVRVLQVSTGNVLNLDIREYLIGAVAAEMPASFSNEALKAQAVACHTYILWIMNNADNAPNEFSDISDDSNKHQGYLTKEQMKEKWGDKYNIYYEKIKNAVIQTKDEYVCYNGEPAMTAFHSLSAGKTVSSEELWGYSIPYLTSVEAPGDKLSADLVSENSFTLNEFNKIIKAKLGADASATEKIKATAETEDGYIKEIMISDKLYKCTDIRSAFSLKSPYFKLKITDNNVIFTVYGKGHGVGMSQYSADFMARQGSDYKEILQHFYKGTDIKKK